MENSAHAPSHSESVAVGASPTLPRMHLAFLDGLRAMLALIVVLDHAYQTIWTPEEFDSPSNPFYLLRYLYALGSLCVGGFLVVSGFCLMLPIARKNGELTGGAALFYKRRIRRIVPPYYCAIVLAALPLLVRHPIGKLTAADVFSHLALVHNLFSATIFSINGAFWSIAVESQVYLLFPLIIWNWNRAGKAVTLLTLAFLGIAGSNVTNNQFFSGLCLYLYPMFALGMAAACIAFDPSRQMQFLRTRVPWQLVCLAALGILLLIFQSFGLQKTLAQLAYMYWLVGIAACAVLVMGSQGPLPLWLNWLNWKPLVWVGTFSYSLYLIHIPLENSFHNFAGHVLACSKSAHFLLLAFVGIPLVVALAFVFFWFCERPFLPGSRKTPSQRETAAALSPAP